MVERWEYKIVDIRNDQWTGTGLPPDLNVYFDRLGAEGWELVGTEAVVRSSWFGISGSTVGILAFFKRRLSG